GRWTGGQGVGGPADGRWGPAGPGGRGSGGAGGGEGGGAGGGEGEGGGGAALERAYRESHGRAVATLIRVFGDIDIAEEAVAEAFAVAAQRWPEAGVPPNPGGWIVTAARNKALGRLRRAHAPPARGGGAP